MLQWISWRYSLPGMYALVVSIFFFLVPCFKIKLKLRYPELVCTYLGVELIHWHLFHLSTPSGYTNTRITPSNQIKNNSHLKLSPGLDRCLTGRHVSRYFQVPDFVCQILLLGCFLPTFPLQQVKLSFNNVYHSSDRCSSQRSRSLSRYELGSYLGLSRWSKEK